MASVQRALRHLLTEPARPRRVREWHGAAWLAISTVCIGAFMGQLDASIVTLALPTLQHSFGVGLGAVEWVALGYLLVLVTAVVGVGHLADVFGRKLLYTYGFILFIAASAACGLAPTLGILIGARVLQALGAAMLQANSVALVTEAAPRGQLGRALGLQGTAQALGLAVGPAIGGLLIALGGWRLVFLVNVPAGLAGALLGWFFLPRSRNLAGRQPFDWIGLGLMVPAVVGILAALSFGNEIGWASPEILLAFAGAVALGVCFVFVERRSAAPLLDFRLLRVPGFSQGISTGFLAYLTLFGSLFIVPFFLELSLHRSPEIAGLELSVLPLALGLVAPFAGRLADHRGTHALTRAGMAMAALALLLLALLHGTTAAFLLELCLLGAGLGLFIPANNATVMASAPRTRTGVVGGVLNMTRGIGMAVGIAVAGLVFGLAARTTAATAYGHGAGIASRGLAGACLLLASVAGVAALMSSTSEPHRDDRDHETVHATPAA
ncbi:MAG TPA: DHA2 family efflux MFS transporter permease subunit [Candidatus Saccharimonadales bacterium]|nr:DHA2 family efflux MFS transporter permease subunit [Candidatus Saccharimonadales bacterium]